MGQRLDLDLPFRHRDYLGVIQFSMIPSQLGSLRFRPRLCQSQALYLRKTKNHGGITVGRVDRILAQLSVHTGRSSNSSGLKWVPAVSTFGNEPRRLPIWSRSNRKASWTPARDSHRTPHEVAEIRQASSATSLAGNIKPNNQRRPAVAKRRSAPRPVNPEGQVPLRDDDPVPLGTLRNLGREPMLSAAGLPPQQSIGSGREKRPLVGKRRTMASPIMRWSVR